MRYFSLAASLDLSQTRKTKVPTETVRCERRGLPPALETELEGWFCGREQCWLRITWRSTMGSCSPVSWSRWVHSSQADRPSRRIWELRLAVARARVTRDIGPPSGDMLSSSRPNSSTARSATGFLFGFFAWPSSSLMPWDKRSLSLCSAEKPGAGSTRMVTLWSHKDRSPTERISRPSRRCSRFSLSIREVRV